MNLQSFPSIISLFLFTNIGVDEVQADLCNLQRWCERNGIYINVDKTKIMVFGSKHALDKLGTRELLLDGDQIEAVNLYTYLGIVMDRQVNFEAHAKNITDRASAKIMQLRKMRRFVTKKGALMVYKNMFLPILEYGDILLSSVKNETKKRMQVLQNKALRCALQMDSQCLWNSIGPKIKRHSRGCLKAIVEDTSSIGTYNNNNYVSNFVVKTWLYYYCMIVHNHCKYSSRFACPAVTTLCLSLFFDPLKNTVLWRGFVIKKNKKMYLTSTERRS